MRVEVSSYRPDEIAKLCVVAASRVTEGWSVFLHNATRFSAEKQDAVGEQGCFFDVVRNEHDRRSRALPDRKQLLLKTSSRYRVERAEGFIHQEYIRRYRQRSCNADALFLSTGELSGKARFKPGEADEPEHLAGAFDPLRLAERSFEAERDVGEYPSPGKQPWFLKHETEASAGRAFHRPVERVREACNDAKQRRFPDTRSADDHEKLAIPERQREVLEHLRRSAGPAR
jgi:hypothetical protein